MRTVYERLQLDVPRISREEKLSMSFRAVNDAPASGAGIASTTLVYEIYPRIPGVENFGSMLNRRNTLRQCTLLVTKMNAQHMLKEAIKDQNSPSMAEIENIRRWPSG